MSEPLFVVVDDRTQPSGDADAVDSPVTEHDADHDRWRRPFYAFVTIGIVLALVLGVYQVIDKPVIRLTEVRATWDADTVPRAQVLARNTSTSTTYCIDVTFEAVDTDGLTLESVVGRPTTGSASLRPGQSANFGASFDHLTPTEIREELDDVLAFVTERRAC